MNIANVTAMLATQQTGKPQISQQQLLQSQVSTQQAAAGLLSQAVEPILSAASADTGGPLGGGGLLGSVSGDMLIGQAVQSTVPISGAQGLVLDQYV